MLFSLLTLNLKRQVIPYLGRFRLMFGLNQRFPISAFKGIGTPSIKVDEGYISDLHSRYFTADFSFGLSIIQQIGFFAGVKTSNIDATMDWYEKIAVETECFRYDEYGITSREAFLGFYLR